MQQQQQVGNRSGQVGGMVHGGNLQAQASFYPSPIQRPVPFQQTIPGTNSNVLPRHRVPSRAPPHAINKVPSSAANNQYYSNQNDGVKLENTGLDSKIESTNTKDCKLSDSSAPSKPTNVTDTSAEDNSPSTD
uniref:Uncharacterized protein n=1 Tax=Clastoptera arizonana TaxID=38151 RepID=A0A1B6C5T7_9HEMI